MLLHTATPPLKGFNPAPGLSGGSRPQHAPYVVFDPSACAFPAAKVPLLPSLTPSAIGRSPNTGFELVGSQRRKRVYTRGRYALFDAYRLTGVGKEGCLLAPAYHCRTMLDPAIRLGGEIRLYRLERDLAPDPASLSQLVNRASHPVRALLVTHYFGFAQELAEIARFCDAHGISLIEDCSHALFDSRGHRRLGQHGRYTIASPYKLLPCEEGGMLIPADGAPLPADGPRPMRIEAQARCLADALRRTFSRRAARAELLDHRALDRRIERFLAAPIERGSERRDCTGATSGMYLPHEEGLPGTLISRALMYLCNVEAAAARRRDNYRRWLDVVRSLPNCRPLFPELPDDCVPYMFPLYIDHPAMHFYALKQLGMPIWRWDEMAESDCSVAMDYRLHILHLPCHQSLSNAEMDWMTAAVAKVMRDVPAADR